MSRTHHHGKWRIKGDRRKQPDSRRLAKALMLYVEAKREAEAMAEAEREAKPSKEPEPSKPRGPQ